MIILTDTREQLPLWNVRRVKLEVGDYTTSKLFGRYHIERKSLSDLYGTLTSGNQRFKKELFRAAYFRIELEVYVEGTYDDFINKRFPKGAERKFSTEGLERLVKTFTREYYLHFEWCQNRADCLKKVEKALKSRENALRK